MPDDPDHRHEATQAVAAAFHLMRAERKKAQGDKPKSVPGHHRAATDWWNFVDRR